MWIENLPDGRFKFRERYKDPLTGKSFKVSVTVAKNTRLSMVFILKNLKTSGYQLIN